MKSRWNFFLNHFALFLIRRIRLCNELYSLRRRNKQMATYRTYSSLPIWEDFPEPPPAISFGKSDHAGIHLQPAISKFRFNVFGKFTTGSKQLTASKIDRSILIFFTIIVSSLLEIFYIEGWKLFKLQSFCNHSCKKSVILKHFESEI